MIRCAGWALSKCKIELPAVSFGYKLGQNLRPIIKYNNQHSTFRRILNTHWHLLKYDLTLSLFVDSEPHVTFRHNQSLRDILVTSHCTTPSNQGPGGSRPRGTYHCRACTYCQFTKPGKMVHLPTGENMYCKVNVSLCQLQYH